MLSVLFLILLILGIGLTCIPVFPGLPVMFFLTLIYALIDRFQHLTPLQLLLFGIIAALSIAIDHFSGLIGAKLGGANKTSIIAGMIGLLAGLIWFPPFGAFLGLFIGVFLAELTQFGDHLRAFKAAGASLAGALTGMIAKIALAVGFVILFMVFVF